jgi:hypothetical protein
MSDSPQESQKHHLSKIRPHGLERRYHSESAAQGGFPHCGDPRNAGRGKAPMLTSSRCRRNWWPSIGPITHELTILHNDRLGLATSQLLRRWLHAPKQKPLVGNPSE